MSNRSIPYSLLTILIFLTPLSVLAQNPESSLDAWEKACSRFMENYKDLPADKLESALLNENTLLAFQGIPELDRLNMSMEGIFYKLLQNKGNRSRLAGSEQALLRKMEAKGLQLNKGEGHYWFQPSSKFFYQAFLPYVSAEMQAYLNCLNSQPDTFFSDGGLKFPVRDYVSWAVQWDEFLVSNPGHSQSAYAQEQYRFLMMTAFFCDLPNTPAFPRYNKGKMEKDWVLELRAAIKDKPDGRTATIVNDFLKAVERNGNKISKSERRRIEKRILAVK